MKMNNGSFKYSKNKFPKKGLLKGHVRWFDCLSGIGVIRDEKGNCHDVHYSAIYSKDKHKSLSKNELVEFTTMDSKSPMSQVTAVRKTGGLRNKLPAGGLWNAETNIEYVCVVREQIVIFTRHPIASHVESKIGKHLACDIGGICDFQVIGEF